MENVEQSVILRRGNQERMLALLRMNIAVTFILSKRVFFTSAPKDNF
jgi:hypothetical protein